MKLLESVPRQAIRFILSCGRDPKIRSNYKSRLLALNLLPVSYWLVCRDLCFAFKCINGLLNVQNIFKFLVAEQGAQVIVYIQFTVIVHH